MTALHNVALFITQLFFNTCVFVILLRIFLQYFRANINNPICQLTARASNPIVLPLRKILPRVQCIDLASLILLIIIELLKFATLSLLQHVSVNFSIVLILSITDILLQAIDILFYAIIIRIILSWVRSASSAYLNEIVFILTEPMLSRIRRLLPVMANFDLSPIVAFILLKILSIIILSYLPG